jgi:hypothetical protein
MAKTENTASKIKSRAGYNNTACPALFTFSVRGGTESAFPPEPFAYFASTICFTSVTLPDFRTA